MRSRTWLLISGILALFPHSPIALNNLSTTASLNLTRLHAFEYKPRVFILSDILAEVDDSESLVRYLLYSNEFDTRGICAVTSQWLQNVTHPQAMRDIIDAYGEVVDNLNNHVHPDARYQNGSTLLSLVTSGPIAYGTAALSQPLSEGADMLLSRLEESSEPLWILAWGGMNTLAQALQHLQTTASSDKAAALRACLRVFAISDQDNSGPWIRTNFPDVFYTVSLHAWNAYSDATWWGVAAEGLPGANDTVISDGWLGKHIQVGPLGAQYPSPLYLMEGDTPSFLYLIQNGLGHSEQPQWGSWGGRYGYLYPGSRHYHNTVDAVLGADGGSHVTSVAGVWRWREHYQNDFAARMQWTLTSDFANASHPPVIVVNGTQGPEYLDVMAQPGETIVLDASATWDPDYLETNEGLEFVWYQYREPSAYATSPEGLVDISLAAVDGRDGTLGGNAAGFANVVVAQQVKVTVPEGTTGLGYHVILQVSSERAAMPVTRYLRVVIEV